MISLLTTLKRAPDNAINALLAERIAAGDFPSAVYLVAEGGRVIFADALGHAVVEPERIAAHTGTIYDLASLTKPLITGLLCARRIERGELELNRPVAADLPEFAHDMHAQITLRHLLTHTSGLPAWRPLQLITDDERERVLGAIAAQSLASEIGTRVVYSDLGFITLGLLLERITATPLAELARVEIFAPLQLKRACFNPPRALLREIAASEINGNAYERGMSATSEPDGGASGSWRENLIWGEAHDGNAHFLGGAAGHAGLFSDARETYLLAQQFMTGRTQLLAPETCALFRTNLTHNLNEARSFAWQLAATVDSTAGDALAPDSFGHLGFTGTSCWLDAGRERIFILLTNRTHTRTLPFVNINNTRRRFHTLAVAALERADDSG